MPNRADARSHPGRRRKKSVPSIFNVTIFRRNRVYGSVGFSRIRELSTQLNDLTGSRGRLDRFDRQPVHFDIVLTPL
jgi:hypothetical protein